MYIVSRRARISIPMAITFFCITEFFREGYASLGIPKNDYICLCTTYPSTSKNKVWSRT